MNDHIPDAGKMVCPKCGVDQSPKLPHHIRTEFECGSDFLDGVTCEGSHCVERQRDQLRARVEELESWIRGLQTHPDSDGYHKSIDPDWQWVAKGRQIYVGTPKPEGLR
jgi:hypothetical protein